MIVPLFCLHLLTTPVPKMTTVTVSQESYRIPYILSDTQHLVVRAKVNSKGPFHFVIDSGAPDMFLSTEAAKACGVTPDKFGQGKVKNLEIEGGLTLAAVGCVVNSPFQLTTMNRIGVAGTKLDGVLGYRILSKFKIDIDLNKRYLTWTKSAYKPGPPARLSELLGGRAAPSEKDVNDMASLASFAASLVGDKPISKKVIRGYIGIQVKEANHLIVITSTTPKSPAAMSGINRGDIISGIRVGDGDREDVATYADVLKRMENVQNGDNVLFYLQRGNQPKKIWVTASKGIL